MSEENSPLDRLVTLGKLAWRAKTPEIEAIGYTPEEFNKAPAWEFACEVRKTGVKVHQRCRCSVLTLFSLKYRKS